MRLDLIVEDLLELNIYIVDSASALNTIYCILALFLVDSLVDVL